MFFYLRIQADPSVETRVRIHGSKAKKIKNAAEIKHFWPILPFLVNVAGSVDPQIKKQCGMLRELHFVCWYVGMLHPLGLGPYLGRTAEVILHY